MGVVDKDYLNKEGFPKNGQDLVSSISLFIAVQSHPIILNKQAPTPPRVNTPEKAILEPTGSERVQGFRDSNRGVPRTHLYPYP